MTFLQNQPGGVKAHIFLCYCFVLLLLVNTHTVLSDDRVSADQLNLTSTEGQVDAGWYFYPYFLGVELQNSLSSFYMSRVEEAPNRDILAIGGGQKMSGEYVGLLFRYRNGNWSVIDEFELASQDGFGKKSLPLYINNLGDIYYSDGYNLLVFSAGSKYTYTPENSGLPEPENDGNERMVDIIRDADGNNWLLYSYPRLVRAPLSPSDWDLYDHTNSPLPEPVDSIGIDIELPARHLAVTGDDLWITTHQAIGGLIRKTGDDWEQYTTENSDLPSNIVSSVVAQSENQLWVSTLPTEYSPTNGGLVFIDNGNWTVYTADNSLPTNYVRAHVAEGENYMWASFGSGAGNEDDTHAGFLAEFDGTSWNVVAQKEEFYNYLGWLSVDSNHNKWLAGDFLVISGGVASLNQAYLTFTDVPDEGVYYNAGTEVTLRWEAGSRVESISFSYSTDSGDTWQLIESGVDPDDVSYLYALPDAQHEEFMLKVSSDNHENVTDVSGTFSVLHPDEPFYHLRILLPDGSYELYDPLVHGWQMDNSMQTMWPEEKWQNIEYEGPLARWPERGESWNFPSFDALVRAFGENRTISGYTPFYNNIIPTLQARVWWIALKNQGYNGVCHGFSVTSLLAFSDGMSVLNSMGASLSADNLYDIEVNNDVRRLMSTVWARQWSRDHFPAQFFNTLSENALLYLVQLAGELTIDDLLAGEFADLIENEQLFRAPSRTLEDVKAMLSVPAPGVYYHPLLLFPEDDIMGGHSVLAYKVEQDEQHSNIWRIYIHDSNFPDDTGTYVTVDTDAEYYEYNEPDGRQLFNGRVGLFMGDSSEGYKTTSRMLYKPVPTENDDDIRQQIAGLDDIGYMFTLFSPETDVKITDGLGNSTSLEGNSSSRNIPGSFPIVPLVGDAHNPMGYFLLDLEYDVELEYVNGGEGNFTAFSDNKMYSYINYETSEHTVDRLRYGNSLSVYGSDQTFDMEIMYKNHVDEQMFRMRDISTADGDSISFNLENGNELAINNYGAPTSLDLELRTDFGDEDYFYYEGLELDGSTGYKIAVPDWEDIADQEVTLLIDTNMDGEYDDSRVITSIPTSKGQNNQQGMPEDFGLYQNYPNPFNPATTIRFALPDAGNVELVIYDMLGRKVETLIDGYKEAGYHEAVFNAGGLSSGVYIYQIRSGDFVESKQLMLVK